jgi:predicted anti-sigma-YlaC factor YlaD
MDVTCERYREAASARLDGEPLGMSASALEHHLSGCPDCAAWLETASHLGRLYRVTGQIPPDLTDSVIGRVILPAARVRGYRRRLRISLAALGLLQWALATPGLFGDSVGMAMSMHASHESAAWNLALGAAFLSVAIKPARAAGTLPILATFVVVLGALSLPDIAAGLVQGSRLASHIGVVIGLVLVGLMSRSERLRPSPAGSAGKDSSSAEGRTFGRRQGAA